MPRALLIVPSLVLLLMLVACSSSPPRSALEAGSQATARAPIKGGGYYKDDGPGENPPDLDRIPDAQPKAERLSRYANNPYQAFGKDYVPMRVGMAYSERGIASWYGRRYHGQKTSSGETYDMYSMTAAHPTLPIPSYARVTNVANGRTVVVRINDRGPFHSDRLIDLSYVAAYKLGYVQAGSALVEVDSVTAESAPIVAAVAPQPAPVVAREPAQAAAPLPVSTEPGGVFLQLGAFSVRDNAESFRAKIYKELSWLTDPMQVNAQGGIFRLQLGPYRTQEDARQMADRIRTELNLQPVVLVR
jgi:rare lipoprotein A